MSTALNRSKGPYRTGGMKALLAGFVLSMLALAGCASPDDTGAGQPGEGDVIAE